MVVAIIAVFSLVQQTTSFLPLSGQRLMASYLAQEGIEIIRNLRDSNKVKEVDWLTGLTGCAATGCEADYSSQSLTPWTTGRNLLNDGSFYNYALGQATSYQRKITLTTEDASENPDPDTDILKIEVQVLWQEKGRTHSFLASEKLYNW
ncbi:MAG: hypothetical protein Q8N16_03015 [bacterium]|nr:hypothetical protein [bacterium]